MTSNLATQLREGTSKSHTMAENVNFIKSFLGGVIDKGSYTEMLSKLYFVYEAIETAMEKNKDHDYIKPIYFPELNRTESLRQDLEFHYGDNWLENTPPSAATLDYVNRINQISEEKPELLVAHAYTRYLGDLSGGQMIRKKTPGPNRFYTFKDVAHKTYKPIVREVIHSYLSLYEEDVRTETQNCFIFATRLFGEMHDLGKIITQQRKDN